jgi:hypothetical protein
MCEGAILLFSLNELLVSLDTRAGLLGDRANERSREKAYSGITQKSFSRSCEHLPGPMDGTDGAALLESGQGRVGFALLLGDYCNAVVEVSTRGAREEGLDITFTKSDCRETTPSRPG